jgi:hypothetical protein
MALLKHPLTLVRPRSRRHQKGCARSRTSCLPRHLYGQGLDGVADAVKAARSEERRRKSVTNMDQETALRLVQDLNAL